MCTWIFSLYAFPRLRAFLVYILLYTFAVGLHWAIRFASQLPAWLSFFLKKKFLILYTQITEKRAYAHSYNNATSWCFAARTQICIKWIFCFCCKFTCLSQPLMFVSHLFLYFSLTFEVKRVRWNINCIYKLFFEKKIF